MLVFARIKYFLIEDYTFERRSANNDVCSLRNDFRENSFFPEYVKFTLQFVDSRKLSRSRRIIKCVINLNRSQIRPRYKMHLYVIRNFVTFQQSDNIE